MLGTGTLILAAAIVWLAMACATASHTATGSDPADADLEVVPIPLSLFQGGVITPHRLSYAGLKTNPLLKRGLVFSTRVTILKPLPADFVWQAVSNDFVFSAALTGGHEDREFLLRAAELSYVVWARYSPRKRTPEGDAIVHLEELPPLENQDWVDIYTIAHELNLDIGFLEEGGAE